MTVVIALLNEQAASCTITQEFCSDPHTSMMDVFQLGKFAQARISQHRHHAQLPEPTKMRPASAAAAVRRGQQSYRCALPDQKQHVADLGHDRALTHAIATDACRATATTRAGQRKGEDRACKACLPWFAITMAHPLLPTSTCT